MVNVFKKILCYPICLDNSGSTKVFCQTSQIWPQPYSVLPLGTSHTTYCLVHKCDPCSTLVWFWSRKEMLKKMTVHQLLSPAEIFSSVSLLSPVHECAPPPTFTIVFTCSCCSDPPLPPVPCSQQRLCDSQHSSTACMHAHYPHQLDACSGEGKNWNNWMN